MRDIISMHLLIEQYTDYLSGVAVGDFGPSFRYPSRTVSELIFTGLPITFELAIYSIFLPYFLGIGTGIISALKKEYLS